ncbi:MAG: PLD nuclease N-terminal domain-containing protein [Desulfosudaceae bacterium]
MPSLPIIVIAVGLICYTLTCWALIDVAQRRFSSIVEKAIWAGVAFFPFIGWLIYLLFGRRRGSCRLPLDGNSP